MDRRMWWVGNGRHCLNLHAGTYAATSWYQAWCVSVVLSVLVAGAKHFAWWVARFYNFVRAHTAIWLPLAVPILSLPSTKVKRDIGAQNARTFTWKIAYFCWLYIWSIIICQLLFFHWVLNLSLVLIYFKVLNAWLILFLQDLQWCIKRRYQDSLCACLICLPNQKNKNNYVLFVIRMTKGRQTAIGYSNMVGCSHSQRWACKVLLLVLLLEA